MTHLNDPYKGQLPCMRVISNVAEPDALILRTIIPYKGIMQATVNTLLYAFVNELKRRGIDCPLPENQNEYKRILDRMCAAARWGACEPRDLRTEQPTSLPGSTVVSTPNQEHLNHVTGGTDRPRDGAADAANVVADASIQTGQAGKAPQKRTKRPKRTDTSSGV